MSFYGQFYGAKGVEEIFTISRSEFIFMKRKTINRHISVFDKKTEFLVWRIRFSESLTLEKLQKIFNEPSSNPMYESFEITKDNLKAIQKLVPEKIDLKKFDYFVDCFSYDPTIEKYKNYDTKTWYKLEKALYNLLLNQDISITTDPDLVTGYLTNAIIGDSNR